MLLRGDGGQLRWWDEIDAIKCASLFCKLVNLPGQLKLLQLLLLLLQQLLVLVLLLVVLLQLVLQLVVPIAMFWLVSGRSSISNVSASSWASCPRRESVIPSPPFLVDFRWRPRA